MIATILAGGLIAGIVCLKQLAKREPDELQKLSPQLRMIALHVEHASRFNL